MAALMARELLKNEVEALPEPMAAEVLDFVLFVKTRHAAQPQVASPRPLTIDDLGWSQEKAAVIREQLAPFVEDWDDPRLDVYNAL